MSDAFCLAGLDRDFRERGEFRHGRCDRRHLVSHIDLSDFLAGGGLWHW